MSRVIGQCNSMRKPATKFRQRFKTLALAISFGSLGLPFLTAYPQTISVVTQQGSLPDANTQAAFAPRTPAVDGARLPDLSSLDIPLLIRDCDRLGTAMHLRLPEYTYLQTRLSRELDQRGKLVEHVSSYEAYPIIVLGHHRHVISLVSEDGAPISPKRLKKERQQASKEMETAVRESVLQNSSGQNSSGQNSSGQNSSGQNSSGLDSSEHVSGAPTASAEKYVSAGIGVSQAGDGVWIGVSQFLQQCRFSAPRYVRLADRDVIALNIHSCATNMSSPRERYLARMAGVVWIDAADKVVARLEAWPRRAGTEDETPYTLPDAETLVYEQMRLPNGLWVPKRIRLNALGKAALFNGTDKDMTFEFSQYQRFSTEVKDLQQMTLKSKP